MVEKKQKVSEKLLEIGRFFYGEAFNLDNPKLKEAYRFVYEKMRDRLIEDGEKHKSVLLIGGVGTGKSALMRIMQRYFKDTDCRFKWVNGYELKDLSEVYTAIEIKQMYGKEYTGDLYIDDIGFSVDVKRYGNTVNIISEIIMERYDLYISSGILTHFSSNILPSIKDNSNNYPTIEKLYGVRVLDRMKEMCEIISFNGESLRK